MDLASGGTVPELLTLALGEALALGAADEGGDTEADALGPAAGGAGLLVELVPVVEVLEAVVPVAVVELMLLRLLSRVAPAETPNVV